jgi:hypothetical protein
LFPLADTNQYSNVQYLPGNFSGPKQQEFVVAKGSFLELLRPDDTGKIISICSTPVFSIIRSILPFRLSGIFATFVNLYMFCFIKIYYRVE